MNDEILKYVQIRLLNYVKKIDRANQPRPSANIPNHAFIVVGSFSFVGACLFAGVGNFKNGKHQETNNKKTGRQ